MPKGGEGEGEGEGEGGAHIFLEFGVRAHRRMWDHHKGRSVSDADAG